MSKKSYFLRRLIILATALLFAWVGISCKNNRPTEEGGMQLAKPEDKEDVIGGDGSLTDPAKIKQYEDEMINIRLIQDSSDGEAYYRLPVVVPYGNNGMGIAMFMEKRFGQTSAEDVGVDGNARVDIVYLANDKGGDNLSFNEGDDAKIGNDPSAQGDKQYSKGCPVVFVDKNLFWVVAASGAGNRGGTSRGESEVKIAKGSASGSRITFEDWQELSIEFVKNNVTNEGSAAIREYVKDKIDRNFNAFYTRWGHGKMSADKQTWILPLRLLQRNENGTTGSRGGLLVLYSTNAGTTWTFGPYMKFNGTDYNEGLGLSVSDDGTTAKVALVPYTRNRPVGIASVTLTDNSGSATAFAPSKKSSFQDSYNNFEMNKKDADNAYFINTRERNDVYYNGFLVNKKLTIALLNDPADDLQESTYMLMSRISGSGSVAVLSDNTIVTFAEEAFAENVRANENRYNIVQRRFTKGYIQKRAQDTENPNRILLKEEFYNPNLNENDY